MREVFYFYREMQKQYAWLHIIFAVLLACTVVFWFFVPLFIICYGLLDLKSIEHFFTFIGLFILPAVIVTSHCWFISFQAAKQWSKNYSNGKRLQWVLVFQCIAFTIVLSYTTTLYVLFIVIDWIR